jgi:E3 ubiquitin-protein ligase HECTD1
VSDPVTGLVLDSRLTCLTILSYPPRTFLPALCKIFLDENAPDNVLEATARSLTYYLDVSQECTRRIVSVDGTIKAICSRLLVIEVDNKISKDLAEQCIKTLELICARESSAVYEANGLTCILTFILDYGKLIFKGMGHASLNHPQDSRHQFKFSNYLLKTRCTRP